VKYLAIYRHKPAAALATIVSFEYHEATDCYDDKFCSWTAIARSFTCR